MRTFLILATLGLPLTGCNRMEIQPSVYDPQGIQDVKTWYIGFTYYGGSQSETARGAGDVEQTTVNREAPRKDDLQFRDDFEFRLRDRLNLRTTRDAAAADGTISVHLMYYFLAGIKSTDVLITDRAGTVLGRIKIVNGQDSTVIEHYQKFAQFCADEVGKVLRP